MMTATFGSDVEPGNTHSFIWSSTQPQEVPLLSNIKCPCPLLGGHLVNLPSTPPPPTCVPDAHKMPPHPCFIHI